MEGKKQLNCRPLSDKLNWLYVGCIALMPVFCLVNVPYLNISLATALLFLSLPYAATWVLMKAREGTANQSLLRAYFPFVCFYLYMVMRSDGNLTRIVLCILTLLHIIGLFYGSVSSKKIKKMIEWYAIINSILVLLQTLSYYVFDLQIQYIPQALIHEHFKNSYVFQNEPGLYRPSALFLEPAHFSQFCCFAIISLLFPPEGKPKIHVALVIAVGCLLTTSGMGIVLTGLIFALFSVRWCVYQKKMNVLKWQTLLTGILLVLLVGVLLLQIPFVKTALLRVFSTVDGYNAILGRLGLWKWKEAIGTMEIIPLLFGYGYSAEYPHYLTGLADTIYKFGILAVLLQGWCLLSIMKKQKTVYIWCVCCIFFLLFCVAHLTSVFSQIFYFALVISEVVFYERTAKESGL